MLVETFQRLREPAGQRLVAAVAAAPDDEPDLALGTRLRRDADPELVAAAIGQVRLRQRAMAKLGADASRMYFTDTALEQATRATVAAHRAQRLANTDLRGVVDLGCGIGADLLAFGRAGLAPYGVDLQPLRAAMAQANLEALALPGAVAVADAASVRVPAGHGAFVDPVRRRGGRRVFDPRQCDPPWSLVTELLTGHAAAKTLPGIAHDLVPGGVEAEWVSDGGDLVEACLWGAPFATTPRRATVLPSGASLTAADDPGKAGCGPAGPYLYEPDDAVTRAGLVTAVAALTGGWLLDPHIAYVGANHHVKTPFARAYRVLEEVPYREKQLRAALRARDVGTLTVKKRGVQVVPEQLVRRLGLRGSRAATVVLTRVAGTGRAYLVEHVPARGDKGGSGDAGQATTCVTGIEESAGRSSDDGAMP